MFHHVAHAAKGRLLFCTWTEGLALWTRLVAALPRGTVAMFIMPDHVHVQHIADVRKELIVACRAHAKWLNRRRRTRAPLWRPVPAPHVLATVDKQRRSERYIALNGVRGGLHRCPLEWPLSTHRDATGLVLSPVREVVRDPLRYHRAISVDHDSNPHGTDFPVEQTRLAHVAGVEHAIVAAVSALTRTPMAKLQSRGRARSLLVRSLCALTSLTHRAIAEVADVSTPTVDRARGRLADDVRLVARVAFDPRFEALAELDLRRLPAWGRYRHLD